MSKLEDKIRFCQEHIVTKEGKPWSITGRSWVVEEFFKPVDGWRWVEASDNTCEDCLDQVGEIVPEYTWHNPSIMRPHSETGCTGLKLVPIIMTVLNLPRRGGKTFNTAAYCIETICKNKNKSITYVASAGKQAATLFRDNFEAPILRNPKLSKACEIVGNRVTVKKTRSFFEYVETSHKSITGRGRSHIVLEEARDLSVQTAMAFLPTVLANNGVECPAGHMSTTNSADAPKKCTICNKRLVPWAGRILIISSSGIIDGTDNDWFAELVGRLDLEPHRNVHMYKTSENINPDISEGAQDMMADIFGNMETTRTYIDPELNNEFRRKGEDFISSAELNRVVDKRLSNAEGSPSSCIGFLDTSTTVDLTSLVILANDPPDDFDPDYEAWDDVVVARVDIWDPAKQHGKAIDERAIQAHLDRYMPLFPAMELYVDTRVMPWAERLVKYCRAQRKSWGRRVHRWQAGKYERNAGYMMLEQRILERSIRLPDNRTLKAEILAARKVKDMDNRVEVREASRKQRHLDVIDGLQTCCFLAYEAANNKRTRLTEVARPSEARKELSRSYRPATSGLGLDKGLDGF